MRRSHQTQLARQICACRLPVLKLMISPHVGGASVQSLLPYCYMEDKDDFDRSGFGYFDRHSLCLKRTRTSDCI